MYKEPQDDTQYLYKELVDEMDFYAVANEFVGSSEHRLRLFGTFTA